MGSTNQPGGARSEAVRDERSPTSPETPLKHPEVPNSPESPSLANFEVTKARHLLLVDDDPTVLRALGRMLRSRGYVVSTAESGSEAVQLVTQNDFDAILSDIAMPEMDGITLLREIRSHDLHVPVILVTGEPTVDTAVQALEYGAMHYLTKPVPVEALEQTLDKAIHLRRMARVRQRAAELLGQSAGQATDRAGLEATFQRCIDTLWMAYQPIVSTSTRRTVGFEALMRSAEPSLPHPGAVLDAAERLGQLDKLGRTVRERTVRPYSNQRRPELLFVNLHVSDLLDAELLSREAPLSSMASQVVLEITERSSLDKVTDVRARISALREMGFRIAVDDLGAGYAGLTSFALLEPDFVKLDMSLVRSIDSSPTKQKIVRSMTGLCHEMRMQVVAEGVETAAECRMLLSLECDLLQGFLFARPGPPFPEAQWPPA
ncbi:MAG TPA: EAL domain-containing protein [Polyangiaceae bacterium]|nr:EAL domain-containing protein [Polyangiaceae bacterium]